MNRGFAKRTIVHVAIVSALIWVIAGPAMAQEDVTGSISASDQTGDGSTVEVDEVTIEGAPGFVVVHLDDDGAPGQVLGHAAIPEGTSTDVTVTLDTSLQADATLWPMLHVDAGEVGTYEFPGEDGPVLVEGEIVMVAIAYTTELPLTGGPSPLLGLTAVVLLLGGLVIVGRLRRAS